MKRSIRIMLLGLAGAAQFTASAQLVSSGTYYYNAPLAKRQLTVDARTQWWNEYLEWPVNEEFFEDLLGRIDSGEVTVLAPEYPFDRLLTRSETKNILHPFLEECVQNPETGDFDTVRVPINIYAESISSLNFYEEWLLDEQVLSFEKKVKGFTLNEYKRVEDGYWGYPRPLVYVPVEPLRQHGPNEKVKKPDVRKVQGIQYMYAPLLPEPYDNEGLWEQARASFFLQRLKYAALTHPALLRDTLFPYTGVLSADKLKLVLAQIDSANAIRFLEDWEMDVNRQAFVKKVRGVVFVRDQRRDPFDTLPVKDIAFLPLNEHTPAPIISSSSFNVPGISYTSVFRSLPVMPGYSQIGNADSTKVRSIGVDLLDRVKRILLPAYPSAGLTWDDDPWQKDRKPKSQKEVQGIFYWMDTTLVMDPLTEKMDKVLTPRSLEPEKLVGYRFFETWQFDRANLKFSKSVAGLSPQFAKYSDGEFRALQEIMNIDIPILKDQVLMEKPDMLVGTNITTALRIDFSDDTREYDDGRPVVGYGREHFQHIQPSLRYAFVQAIINDAVSGKLKVYDPESGKKLSKTLVVSRINQLKDSVFVAAYGKSDIPVDYVLVNKLVFDEDWYYDPARQFLYKKVNSITFVNESRSYGESGPVLIDKKIFTLQLK